MNIIRRSTVRASLLISLMLVISVGSSRLQADTGICRGVTITLPFTDVMGDFFFCSIAEAFFSGLANGTDPTHYSPGQNVPRDQMAAFVARTLDQSLKRGSRRAALKQFWTPTSADSLGLTTLGSFPGAVASDGTDLWVANNSSVCRVRASDGKLLETWTGTGSVGGVLAARGKIYVTGGGINFGRLLQIDPTQPAGPVTTLTSSLGASPATIAFDGSRIWTANATFPAGSISIVTLNPVTVTTVTAGLNSPRGILYDGANMWVTAWGTNPGNLFKLDSTGAIIQTVPVGSNPSIPVFDGTNIWVPNQTANTVTVVRASTGAVLATLAGNGLSNPITAAFDGERILVTSFNRLSLFKAADLSPLGYIDTDPNTFPYGACSDGLNFWITFRDSGELARF